MSESAKDEWAEKFAKLKESYEGRERLREMEKSLNFTLLCQNCGKPMRDHDRLAMCPKNSADFGQIKPPDYATQTISRLAFENGRLRFLLGEAITSMSNAEQFLFSKAQMRPEWRAQWGELIDRMREVIADSERERGL